jgi:diaminohydroxyphosphoribosylaminopyrimidine deaminase/5-amino-6-(5-phosphoribosylamino)uracil reductase
MQVDELFMKRCLELAGNGMGNVAPNPMVGCVIVHNGLIIGEGYHAVFGGTHAEVNAVNSVRNTELLPFSTLYVNLEPCSHFGKTPPCADFILEKGIRRVVIGTADPSEKVEGRGFEKMKSVGVEIKLGVLDEECRELNKRFFTFHTKKRPYVILKWAQTLDGYIDKDRKTLAPKINWITDKNTRMLVHRWRSEEQAILTGTKTVLLDNPQLTVREWSGNNPLRLVIDENLLVNKNSKVLDKSADTIVFNSKKDEIIDNVEWLKIDFHNEIITQILSILFKRDILSLIVEGGRETLQSFIDNGFWDEARIFTGNCFFFGGVRAPEIKGIHQNTRSIGEDKLSFIKNQDI